MTFREDRRVAIVAGLRTPFARSGTDLATFHTLDLAAAVVTELLARSGLDPALVDRVVFGSVVQDIAAPNIAREVVLACPLPDTVDAYSVTRACATSTQSLVDGAQAILLGEADVVITGGADSLSRPPMLVSDELAAALARARRARTPWRRLAALAEIRPRDLRLRPPAIAERSTGETMGEAAERMAIASAISRSDQDAFALASHRKSVEAWEKGIYRDEVMPLPVPPRYTSTVETDTIPRPDTSLAKLAALPPVFDPRHGTVTAGNSSPLTDGAAALLIMEAGTAERLGLSAKAYLRSWAFAAVDPADQLLIGPAVASPLALDRAGLTMADMDLVDIHEAFAAQVLSVLKAFTDQGVGDVPEDRLNLYGGSISLGHPFAATSARQVLTVANELERRDGGTALVTQCAAGGLGAAVVLERP